MKAFGKYVLLSYFLLTGTLICSAQDAEAKTSENTTAKVATTETVEEIPTASLTIELSDNVRVNSFLISCKKISDQMEEMNSFGDVWYWSNSHNKDTYIKQSASDEKVCNDALFVCWGLADCKIFTNGERFYTNKDGKIVYNKGNSEETINKYFDIIEMDGTAKELVKEKKIVAGDICCYDFQHTNVYAGNNLWFDPSPKSCEVETKNGKDYFKKILTPIGAVDHNVNYVIRFKDKEAEKEEKKIVSSDKKENTTKSKSENTYADTGKKDCASFLAALKKISDKFEEDHKAGKTWYYSNSKCKGTFASAVKTGTRKTNCARYVNWGLSEIGVLDGESFYTTTKGTIKWSSDKTKKKVTKYCRIISVKKKMSTLIKDGTLKAGDICCYNFQHTNVYAGNNTWFDGGRRADTTYKKGGTSYFKSLYSKKANKSWVVNYIIRLKE